MDKETVDGLRTETERLYTKYHLLKDLAEKAEKEYLKKSAEFKKADYKLAEEDGRLKKIPASGKKGKREPIELTLDQLKSIAEKLGIDLNSMEVE